MLFAITQNNVIHNMRVSIIPLHESRTTSTLNVRAAEAMKFIMEFSEFFSVTVSPILEGEQ